MLWSAFSWWTLAVAAVVQMGGGILWYGPLFGRAWMQAMGIDPADKARMADMQKSAGPAYATTLLFAMVFGYVIDVLLASLDITAIGNAVLVTTVLWLSLTFANTSKAVMWGEMSRNVLIINSGFEWLFFTTVGIAACLL